MRGRGLSFEEASWTLPSAGEVARIAALLLFALLLQSTVASHVRILGVDPDFILIAVVCVALLRGSEVGALFGFLAGALVAVVLMEPIGLSASIFVIVGFLTGRYVETADLSAGFAPLVSVFAGAFAANVLLALAQFLLAREVPLGFFLGRVLIPSLILNTLLASPFYLFVRWWLRGGPLNASRIR